MIGKGASSAATPLDKTEGERIRTSGTSNLLARGVNRLRKFVQSVC